MNDSAPVHRAYTVENCKDQNEVTSMEWPEQSSDLNITENIWLYMKRRATKVRGRYRCQKWSSAWNPERGGNIELDYVTNLYQSIPDRLDNVIKMEGHLTKY